MLYAQLFTGEDILSTNDHEYNYNQFLPLVHCVGCCESRDNFLINYIKTNKREAFYFKNFPSRSKCLSLSLFFLIFY